MKLTPAVRHALAKFIRLLASEVDGEALAAVRALGRALRASGADFHDLAGIVEVPATSGRSDCADSRNQFDGDDETEWQRMVDACTNHPGRFTSRERQFLQTMKRWRGSPTSKQLNWLVALFERVRRAA